MSESLNIDSEDDKTAWHSLEDKERFALPTPELLVRSLQEYLDEPETSETQTGKIEQIIERSPEATPFTPLRQIRGENNEYLSNTAHYIVPGLFCGGNEESFGALANKIGGDVYCADRTGDFCGEHALEGIIKNLQEDENGRVKPYREVEIIAISVAASEMARALEARESELTSEGMPAFRLTLVDPYDKDYLALGDARHDDLSARLTHGLRDILCVAAIVAIHPFKDQIIKKGTFAGEDSSVEFLAQQFYKLSKNRLFRPDGAPIAARFLREGGVITAGEKTNPPENRDEFIDTAARDKRLGAAGVRVIEKAGTHGMTDDETVAKRRGSGLLPSEAYRELFQKSDDK